MSAKERERVLETLLPQQKKKTTDIYAKNTDASITQQVYDIDGKKIPTIPIDVTLLHPVFLFKWTCSQA